MFFFFQSFPTFSLSDSVLKLQQPVTKQKTRLSWTEMFHRMSFKLLKGKIVSGIEVSVKKRKSSNQVVLSRQQLILIFITDQSADCSLYIQISCLACKMAQICEKAQFPRAQRFQSASFVLSTAPNPKHLLSKLAKKSTKSIDFTAHLRCKLLATNVHLISGIISK